MQYFMLGKHSFQIIMRIFGRTASTVRFSILRRRPAPFREGAEYASASYSAALGAHAQAEPSFHRSHSAAKCDVGWQSETLTHTFSTSCSLDKVKRHSTVVVLCLSKIVLTIETKCSMKSGGLSSAIIQPLPDAARCMICSAEDSITFWYS